MTVPTGTFQTHQEIGRREDLTNEIYMISPTDTPFMSNIGRGSASNTLHEWQTDSLTAASSSNQQIEGDDIATDTAVPTVRLGNYTQISTKAPRVASTVKWQDLAGRADEMDYQVAKRLKELKRDMETDLSGANAGTAGSASAARKMAGLGCWLWTNQVQQGASATTPTVTSGVPTTAPTAGTTATFSEANLKTLLAACWDQGGNPTMVLCGSWNKRLISAFSGIGTLYRDAQPSGGLKPGSVIGAADVYVSDFGTHQIVASRFSPSRVVYALDLDYWAVAYGQPVLVEDIGKTGLSDKKLISVEYTLEAKNPDSSGKCYTVSIS